MTSSMFEQKLIQSLQNSFNFHEDQVTRIELLKRVGNNSASAQLLNDWIETGDLSAINDFDQSEGFSSTDGNLIGYYLVHFSSVKIIVSVLEADHNLHLPHVMNYKLLN